MSHYDILLAKKLAGSGGGKPLYRHELVISILGERRMLDVRAKITLLNDYSEQYESLAQALYENGYSNLTGYGYSINEVKRVYQYSTQQYRYIIVNVSLMAEKVNEQYSMYYPTIELSEITDNGVERIDDAYSSYEIFGQHIYQICPLNNN